MAWIKVPAENHAPFRAALPPRATTKNMFGGVAAFVNDRMFGGLFARSIIVKLGDAHHEEALALDGASPFDPMGNGRIMGNTVLMPESVMDDPSELRTWLKRGFDYVATLPPKKTKAPAKKPKAAPKAKTRAKPRATAKKR